MSKIIFTGVMVICIVFGTFQTAFSETTPEEETLLNMVEEDITLTIIALYQKSFSQMKPITDVLYDRKVMEEQVMPVIRTGVKKMSNEDYLQLKMFNQMTNQTKVIISDGLEIIFKEAARRIVK